MPASPASPRDNIRIRPCDSSNIIDLIRLGDETGLSAWSHDDLLAEIKNPYAIVLRIQSDDNSILGFVVGRIVPSGREAGEKDAEVYNIAIDPDHQRRGLGQALLDAFLSKCNKGSVSSVWLEVRESNLKAVKFYEKNEFEHVQTRKNFYRAPPEDALLMRLSLKNETA